MAPDFPIRAPALILALSLAAAGPALAQEQPPTSPGLPQPGDTTRSSPIPPTSPPLVAPTPPMVDPVRPEASAPAPGDTLSDRLARSDGVLVPTDPEDGQGMQRTPPDPGPNTMPTLPPPGTPGHDAPVDPK